MPYIHELKQLISENALAAWIALGVSFVVLAKCAGIFVDSSVALANRLRIPKLVIGIILVSLATTAPELAVSMNAAIRGEPEMALGNAIGSVICDDGLALPAAGFLAATPILIMPVVLKTAGLFLVFIEILIFLFVLPDYTLNRWEGAVLVALFVGYMIFLFRQHRKGVLGDSLDLEEVQHPKLISLPAMCLFFLIGLGGIILASEFIVTSALKIAESFHVPEAVVALTLVALGTSIPEIATCVTAARKGHGALAVGNILGADIMNICWVAGASSIANDLTLEKKELFFMFPAMFVIVAVMLICLRRGYSLTRKKSAIIFAFYLAYLAASILCFPPQS